MTTIFIEIARANEYERARWINIDSIMRVEPDWQDETWCSITLKNGKDVLSKETVDEFMKRVHVLEMQ